MARTFQITEIFPELTVRENVRIGAESAAGMKLSLWRSKPAAAQVEARIDEMLGLTGLSAKGNRLVGELSHGDQRAAEIAMALTLQPRLLLLDEPTAGMGEQETFQIAGLIRRLHRNSNYTIVLIEHDMRVVFNLADRITVLDQGQAAGRRHAGGDRRGPARAGRVSGEGGMIVSENLPAARERSGRDSGEGAAFELGAVACFGGCSVRPRHLTRRCAPTSPTSRARSES